MFTERQAIQRRMEQIREERRALQEEYTTLLNRLRQLDEQEKEAIDIHALAERIHATAQIFSKILPPVNELPLNELFEQHEETTTTTTIIQETTRKQKYNDLYQVTQRIVQILKERGVPMKVREIEQELAERFGIKWSNGSFYSVISKVIERDQRINRAHHGYYQYKR